LREEGEEFLFARAFLCLEWNLMTRLENIVHAHILHVHWDADCLLFCFVKSKVNQTGWNSDQEWHVYATPITLKFAQFLLFLFTYLQIQVYLLTSQKSRRMVWRWNCRGGMERAALVLTKDAFSLEEISMRNLWIAFIV
jgi:hypothetical protein